MIDTKIIRRIDYSYCTDKRNGVRMHYNDAQNPPRSSPCAGSLLIQHLLRRLSAAETAATKQLHTTVYPPETNQPLLLLKLQASALRHINESGRPSALTLTQATPGHLHKKTKQHHAHRHHTHPHQPWNHTGVYTGVSPTMASGMPHRRRGRDSHPKKRSKSRCWSPRPPCAPPCAGVCGIRPSQSPVSGIDGNINPPFQTLCWPLLTPGTLE